MTDVDLRRIYEVRAERADGWVHAFGARRTRHEADELLRESTERVAAAGGRNERLIAALCTFRACPR